MLCSLGSHFSDRKKHQNMLYFDLQKYESSHMPAMQLLGLLIYLKRFEPQTPAPTYSEIQARLGLPTHQNPSVYFFRLKNQQINIWLPGAIKKSKRNGRATLHFIEDEGRDFTWSGAPITAPLLESAYNLLKPTVLLAVNVPESDLFTAIRALTISEIAFRCGDHLIALKSAVQALLALRADAPRNLRCLLYMHQLRTYRRLEDWRKIEEVLTSARRVLRAWKGEKEAAMLEGLVKIYTAWSKYDRLNNEAIEELRAIEKLLKSTQLEWGATINNYLAFERCNLLSLVMRRIAHKLATDVAVSMDEVTAAENEALRLNLQGVEFAALSSDLTALSNATGNRTLILNEVLKRKIARGESVHVDEWGRNLQWLALSFDIGNKTGLGGDNLWSPIFLLSTHKLCTNQNGINSWGVALQTARGTSDWFNSRPEGEHVIDTALAMSKDALAKILGANQILQTNAARQLIILSEQLIVAAGRTYSFDNSPNLATLESLSRAVERSSKK